MSRFAYIELGVKNKKLIGLEALDRNNVKGLQSNNCIYIYHGSLSKKVYIGQTRHFLERHKEHYSGKEIKFDKANFDRVIILFSNLLDNGTALDDVESQFITYFSADRKETIRHGSNKKEVIKHNISFDDEIINKTLGNSITEYRDREKVATDVILPFWEEVLFPKNYVYSKTLDELRTKALVKYSPIKVLTQEQNDLIDEIIQNPNKNYVINGDAGTGKTVLLTHLVAYLHKNDDSKRIGIVIQPNWEEAAREIFKIFCMNSSNITVASSTTMINSDNEYDVIIIDESHKLSQKRSKQHDSFNKVYRNTKYAKCNSHLEILQKMAHQLVLMYDVLQAIRPANISRKVFANLTKSYEKRFLKTQFRIQPPQNKSYTSDDYVNGIKYLLYKDTGLLKYTNFDPKFNRDVFNDKSADAYFGYVTGKPMQKLFNWVDTDRIFNTEHINRVLSGMFCCDTVDVWMQAHGSDSCITHFHEDGVDRRWNSTQKNWLYIDNEDKEEQIGSVFAVQGIDLNKVGVMIGPDIIVNSKGVLEADPEHHNNNNNKFTKKEMIDQSLKFEFTLFILNQYYILLTRGIDGIRVGFWNNDNFMRYMKETLCINN